MKYNKKVFGENEELKNSTLYYDHVLISNLLLVTTPSYFKKNIRELAMTVQLPKSKQDWGVKFHKNNNFVCIAVCFYNESNIMNQFQLIIKEGCSYDDVLDSEHEFLKPLKTLVLDGIRLNEPQTLESIEGLFKNENYSEK